MTNELTANQERIMDGHVIRWLGQEITKDDSPVVKLKADAEAAIFEEAGGQPHYIWQMPEGVKRQRYEFIMAGRSIRECLALVRGS